MDKPGIYTFLNIKNGKRYVGSTISLQKRKGNHLYHLRNNKHHNSHLQSAWNIYGENNFIFCILEYCDKSRLIENEQFWVDYFKSYNNGYGYNVRRFVERSSGVKHSEESRKKISMSLKGKYAGENSFCYGKTLSEETKRKIKESKKKLGDQFRIKMSIVQRGENNSCAILTWGKVRKIRELWKTKEYTQNQLAEQFGVARGTINNVVNNYQWNEE